MILFSSRQIGKFVPPTAEEIKHERKRRTPNGGGVTPTGKGPLSSRTDWRQQSSSPQICGACSNPLSGAYVRALDQCFHKGFIHILF